MPHDCSGKELKVGDRVILFCTIKDISQNETACNVTVEACDDFDIGEYKPVITTNSRLFSKSPTQ